LIIKMIGDVLRIMSAFAFQIAAVRKKEYIMIACGQVGNYKI
jgi:hypothetical protein